MAPGPPDARTGFYSPLCFHVRFGKQSSIAFTSAFIQHISLDFAFLAISQKLACHGMACMRLARLFASRCLNHNLHTERHLYEKIYKS